MFFILSKTIDFVLMPLSIFFYLVFYVLLTKNHARRQKVLLFTVIYLYAICNGFLVNYAVRAWEYAPVEVAKLPVRSVGIMLTGGVIATSAPDAGQNLHLGSQADRLAQAVVLYKMGKIQKILVSGGSSSLDKHQKDVEGPQIVAFLGLMGVPNEAIMSEPQSRNTHENALFSAKILQNQFPGQTHYLITSAFHGRRAAGCFGKMGVSVQVVPAAFMGQKDRYKLDNLLLPQAENLLIINRLTHEIIGYWVYKLRGYC